MASPSDAGQAASIRSARPTQADSGKPPVSALPKQIRSGTVAVCSQANHFPVRPNPVHFVQDEQGLVLIAQAPEQRQEPCRWDVDPPSPLNRFDQHRPDLFTPEQPSHLCPDRLQRPRRPPLAFALLFVGAQISNLSIPAAFGAGRRFGIYCAQLLPPLRFGERNEMPKLAKL